MFFQNVQFSSLLGEAGVWGALKPISVQFAECCRRLGMGGMGASSGEGEARGPPPEIGRDVGEGAVGSRMSEVKQRVPELSQKGDDLAWGGSGQSEEREGFSQRDREGKNLETLGGDWGPPGKVSPTCRSVP